MLSHSDVRPWCEGVRGWRSGRRVEGRRSAAREAGQSGGAGIDPGTGRVEWSSRMAALHGQTAVAGAGRLPALLAAVHPDDLDEIQRALQGLPDVDGDEGGSVLQVEYRVHAGGQLRWLSTRITSHRKSAVSGKRVSIR